MSSPAGLNGPTPGNWPSYPVAKGTGPLSTPQTGPLPPLLPETPIPFQPAPLLQNYLATAMSPQSVQFNTASPAQVLKTFKDARSLIRQSNANQTEQLIPVPAAWKPRLESLAKDLGFKNFESLQYQLRNLPSAQVDQWLAQVESKINSLPGTETGTSQITIFAKQALTAQADTALKDLFQNAQVPPPVFESRQGKTWSPQAKLAVLNAFSEIRQNQPLETFRLSAQGEGKPGQPRPPITFVRAERLDLNAMAGKDGYLSAMEMLSGSMKVAYHEGCEGKIVLNDGAVHANPRELLQAAQIQDFLKLVNSPVESPEKQRAVRSVQEMLNCARSPKRQLNPSGKMDTATQQALEAFDLQQNITAARDLIEDDTTLGVPQKRRLLQRLVELQGRLDLGQSPLMLKAELGHTLRGFQSVSDLQSNTRERLENQIENLDRPLSNKFDQNTAEKLISNWYGIIDGGDSRDFTEQVIVHELGHGLQDLPEVLENWRRISWDGKSSGGENRNNVMEKTLKGIGQQGFVSDYARVNDEEDFAESYRVFTYQPERLLKESLLKFMFMASVTQAYDGKEQQMLDLIKKTGYKDAQIRDAMLQLRGHLPSETRQYVKGVVDKTTTFSKIVSPLLGQAADMLSEHYKLKDKIADWWADFRGVDQKPQFTPSMASALPKVDHLLNIDGKNYASSPSETGYVLDQMTRYQAVLLKPDSTPAERALARQKIEAFKQTGLNAWPEADRSSFSPEALKTLNGEKSQENKAIVLALSKILGKSYAKADWASLPDRNKNQDPNQELQDEMRSLRQVNSLNAFFEEVRKNPNILRRELGNELYQALPDSFKAMLMEPEFVENITGKRGETSVNATNIFDYTFSEIDRRAEQSGWDFLSNQFKTIVQFVNRDRISQAYQLYAMQIEKHNAGTSHKAPLLSETEFEAAISRFREKQTQPTAPSALKALDTERSLANENTLPQELLMQELKIRSQDEEQIS
ncbi:hypothetical protein COW36_14515 [bacterium (Candidatus Blackallbacteria) CG17_big_fil_post_rev_8_21_14_2_50_48_46]|uniref:Uncharacterized protein n=1 Tax=bacterium (Candidatus Blackallbacteria) CG17_big_fil_post_rev_8_21_14_2_50_48_46 TaxID=2014261 RepID=A0A2M7G2P7_9BACT|nr:MAG: hypothetical protein COW64_12035 [bacterium (Candidatus Blackallbacteria) CG18_big_fil_WC_8_21_14_2_50_49_26]PIW15929.1 MAG: hypothetical protein COW36_14515 [bacterium (Candidatus Blackallbacteria) CG17_big_fil_post_rev_8_21_14_2_50_48_46]PIW50341.1 MAG: hypothetical protein COW20_02230 [bacterium (Candidatus Blackallbacteria) CG13_big_fil_rev_8_21_14_2_50_49_14]